MIAVVMKPRLVRTEAEGREAMEAKAGGGRRDARQRETKRETPRETSRKERERECAERERRAHEQRQPNA